METGYPRTIPNGYYHIITAANPSLGLDVAGGTNDNKANIQVWTKDPNSWKQRWLFIPCGNKVGQTIEDEEYQIALASDPSKIPGVEGDGKTNIRLSMCTKDRRNTFDVTYLGNGHYSIRKHASGLYLDVKNAAWTKGKNLQLYQFHDSDAQKWIIKPNGNAYSIISKCNGLYIDVENGKFKEGNNIQLWLGNGTNAQQWVFLPWKEQPEITALPSASEITYGQSLNESAISGGTVNTAGSFAWKDGTVRPACADSESTRYPVIFTPADTDNWDTMEVNLTLKVKPAPNAPNMPGTALYPAYDKQSVKEVELPPGPLPHV